MHGKMSMIGQKQRRGKCRGSGQHLVAWRKLSQGQGVLTLAMLKRNHHLTVMMKNEHILHHVTIRLFWNGSHHSLLSYAHVGYGLSSVFGTMTNPKLKL